jgi:DNA-binding NarL/FixJ family response regulator
MTVTIFLADDHSVLRDGLRLLLETQLDFKVIGAAANGREALRQMEHLAPTIALLDIAMPEMDGLDLARALRHTHPTTALIMLSMHRTPEHIVQALEAGARGYVLKESASDEVIEAIRTVQAGGCYLSQAVSNVAIEYYLHSRPADGETSPLERLNEREREVLRLLANGLGSGEIAGQLGLSSKTVDNYRSAIMHKLDIHHLPGLVKFAIQHGLISLEI